MIAHALGDEVLVGVRTRPVAVRSRFGHAGTLDQDNRSDRHRAEDHVEADLVELGELRQGQPLRNLSDVRDHGDAGSRRGRPPRAWESASAMIAPNDAQRVRPTSTRSPIAPIPTASDAGLIDAGSSQTH